MGARTEILKLKFNIISNTLAHIRYNLRLLLTSQAYIGQNKFKNTPFFFRTFF